MCLHHYDTNENSVLEWTFGSLMAEEPYKDETCKDSFFFPLFGFKIKKTVDSDRLIYIGKRLEGGEIR